MKEMIEKKLADHAETIMEKDVLSVDDVNFLVFMLSRIEMKESNAAAKEEKERANQAWREKMSGMLEVIGG